MTDTHIGSGCDKMRHDAQSRIKMRQDAHSQDVTGAYSPDVRGAHITTHRLSTAPSADATPAWL